jgi:hypothetical protein
MKDKVPCLLYEIMPSNDPSQSWDSWPWPIISCIRNREPIVLFDVNPCEKITEEQVSDIWPRAVK